MTISIQGSILRHSKFNHGRFLGKLTKIKYEKLVARHNKYDNQNATLADMLSHLFSEVHELLDAIPDKDRPEIYKELADVSNCVDIIFYMLENTHDLSQSQTITPD